MSVGPPALRSPQGIKLDEHAVDGELTLQQCSACQTVQYPPRELCRNCLGDELNWSAVSRGSTAWSLFSRNSCPGGWPR